MDLILLVVSCSLLIGATLDDFFYHPHLELSVAPLFLTFLKGHHS